MTLETQKHHLSFQFYRFASNNVQPPLLIWSHAHSVILLLTKKTSSVTTRLYFNLFKIVMIWILFTEKVDVPIGLRKVNLVSDALDDWRQCRESKLKAFEFHMF